VPPNHRDSDRADLPPPWRPAELTTWFAAEVHSHGPALRSYLRGTFPAVRDVDDVVQESFLRVWTARLRQPIRFSKSFLFQVARRIAIDALRRERSSPVCGAGDEATHVVADERACGVAAACARDEAALLIRAFDALPPLCREVLMLRKLDGLSHREIALRLELSESAVELHVVRGARRLEAFFARHGLGERGK
jgi:RNA polymerase sigma factor (sigma-70 family)